MQIKVIWVGLFTSFHGSKTMTDKLFRTSQHVKAVGAPANRGEVRPDALKNAKSMRDHEPRACGQDVSESRWALEVRHLG